MINYSNKNYIKYSSPLIEIKFTSVNGDKFEASSLEFGGLILSLQTKKSLNSLPGVFSIIMVGKKDFNDFFNFFQTKVSPYELFRPSGLVEISINKKQIMIGLIDSLTKNLTIDQQGRPVKNYTISGRDLGAFLVNHQIWYDDVVYKNREKQNTMMGALSSFGMIGNEKSGEIIEKVINNWMIDVVNKEIVINGQSIEPFQFSDLSSIQDRFIAMLQNKNIFSTNETRTIIQGPGAISNSTYADEYPINIAMSFVGGTLANFIQNVTASPFNELFVDTGDTEVILNSSSPSAKLQKNKVYVIFRPAPFDDNNFNIAGPSSKLNMGNLINFEIDDTIIKQKQLNINKNQKAGVYFVSPSNETLGFVQGKFYTPGEYDELSIRRYGYSTMNVQLNGYEVSQEDSGNIESLVSDFQKKLKSWYERADEFISGTFVIKGDPRVRIGNKLSYIRDEFGKIEEDYEEGYYYITGVSHDWVYGKNYLTTLSVERGVSKKIFKKENQLEPVAGLSQNFLSLRLGA